MKLRDWVELVRERWNRRSGTLRASQQTARRRPRRTNSVTVEELEDRTLLSVLTEQSVFVNPLELDEPAEYSTSSSAEAGLSEAYSEESGWTVAESVELSAEDAPVPAHEAAPQFFDFDDEFGTGETEAGSSPPTSESDAEGGTIGETFESEYVPGQILVKLKTVEVFAAAAESRASDGATTDAARQDAPDPLTLALTAVAEATGAQVISPVFTNLVEGDVADSSTVSLQADPFLQQEGDEPLALESAQKDIADGAASPQSPYATFQSDATPAGTDPPSETPDWSDLARWYSVELPEGVDVDAALQAVLDLPEVETAEPNYLWHATVMERPPVIEGLPNSRTDPHFDDQWHFINAKIAKAWDYLNHNGVYPGGSHDVVVAVIDSGVDYTHPDLAANMWVNPDEIPGNGIDDDGNGIVDDIHGANFVSNPSLHNGDPMDPAGHGTHVAGIIAAQAFNGIGGVGTAFNVQIMAVRAGQYSGVFAVQDVAEAIQYAVSEGADVINMSFGGYMESNLIKDALEVALNQCVLVAAAGNDGQPKAQAPHYPAAYPWVLGVMASTSENKLAWFSNTGYEIAAPGVEIFSTLPGNQYAAWSGTSMATPVVSGIAALMRSYFWQRDIYSSRFIMGSIVASGEDNSGVVDAYRALTEPPQPGVRLYRYWVFDDPSIAAENDGDGRIDAGETIHLGVEVINRSGKAEGVVGTLTAWASGAVGPDPYIHFVTDTVQFGDLGPFSLGDNGLTWNNEGVLTSVQNPFVFTVDPATPNDHVIPFVITFGFRDGWSKERLPMERTDTFRLVVQRGTNLPSVISQDMVLTKDHLWIVGGPVLVEEGATLTIAPGAEVQWGALSSDPYNPGPQAGSILVRGRLEVQGTADEPVELFPSEFVGNQRVTITKDGGTVNIAYARIKNPSIQADRIDHAYLFQEGPDSDIQARTVTNTIFHEFRDSPYFPGAPRIDAKAFDTVLFDNCQIFGPTGSKPHGLDLGPEVNHVYNTVFLPDFENDAYPPLTAWGTFTDKDPHQASDLDLYAPAYYGGHTYVAMYMTHPTLNVAERVANYYEGHIVSIQDRAEQEFLIDYSNQLRSGIAGNWGSQRHIIGLSDDGHPGDYRWTDGMPLAYTNWAEGYPIALDPYQPHLVELTDEGWKNDYRSNAFNTVRGDRATSTLFLLELPGEWSPQQLAEPLQNGQLEQFVRQRYYDEFRWNAILNRYWDPSLARWVRIYGMDGESWYSGMYTNYFGTDSKTLIDYAIEDYNDNFSSAHVDYEVLKHGAETTYPFVESVQINGLPAESVPTIGAGPTVLTVTFNRDMDTSVQPFVTFGPSWPHTDFTVHPVGGNDVGYNDNAARFTVTLSQPASEVVTVDYATVDGSAIGGVDYEPTSGTLTFLPGETSHVISVPVWGNDREEQEKTFFIVLSNPTFASLQNQRAQATLTNDDATLSIDDVTVVEGDSGVTEAVFTVTLSRPLDEPVTVDYETVADTALPDFHYQPVSGTLTFQPGETTQTVTVPVIGNTVSDPPRRFTVRLSHPTRANIEDAEGAASIQDDDPALTVDDVSVAEGDGGITQMQFPVRLSAVPLRPVTVHYRTVDRAATAGEDYRAVSGTLTFPAGGPVEQTVSVPILGDTTEEPTENLELEVYDVQGAVLVDARGDGKILTDDGLVVSASGDSVVERDGGQLRWARYVGGIGGDEVHGVAVDQQGNVFVVGKTASANWAVGGADTSYNGGESDAFLAKLTPDGQILWSTYLGGDQADWATDVAVDDNGFVWVVGTTASAGWASGGFDTHQEGGQDAFVAKFKADGTLLWSSYLGGTQDDEGNGIAVDSAGAAWLCGTTRSSTWVPQNGFDTTFNGATEGFVARISPAGDLLWSTFLGWDGNDTAVDIAVDPSDNGVVAGIHHDSHPRPAIAKIDPQGRLVWKNSYWQDGVPYAIATGPNGDVWMTGHTWYGAGSGPTAFRLGNAWHEDLFVSKVQSDGQLLSTGFWSASSGGGVENGLGIAVDSQGQAWFVGTVGGEGVVPGGFDRQFNGGSDVLVGKISADGRHLLWASYLGGAGSDVPSASPAVGPDGDVWIAGWTQSAGWISSGIDDMLLGSQDGFLAKVGDDGVRLASFVVSLSEAPANPVTVDYTTKDGLAAAWEDYEGVSGTLTFEPGAPLQQTIEVPVFGDEDPEPSEDFFLRLSNPNGAALAVEELRCSITDDDPLASVSDAQVVEGDSGTTAAVFTVTLEGDHEDSVVVYYTTADQTAKAGTDYVASIGSVTLGPHELEKTVEVQILGDEVDEPDETFRLQLTGADGAVLSDAEAVATILDDDPLITIDDVTVVEGDDGTTDAVFTVRLSSQPLQRVVVRYETVDDTAVAGQDYQPVKGALIFEPWLPPEQTITVPVLGDNQDELDESFRVQLSDARNGRLKQAIGTATIADDDPKVSISDVRVVEGDSGTTDARFEIRLSDPGIHPVTVDYATADGTATAGADYTAANGSVTFVPGETVKTVSVAVVGDTEQETNETFTVQLSGASGARIADPTATGTIIADDGPLASITDAQVLEGDSGTSYLQLTVTLSQAATQDASVSYTTADGTATAGQDYQPATGTLLFPAGTTAQTLLVPIVGDTTHEGDETFFVRLTGSTVVGIVDDEAVVTIVCDDPVLTIQNVSLAEGDSGNPLMEFVVSISQDPVDDVTVQYVTADGTATSGRDYLSASGTLTFTPGGQRQQTIAVYLISDIENEVDETVLVNLSNPVNAELEREQAVGTIFDDDGPKIVVSDVTVEESDTGTVQAVFTVGLTEPTTQDVSVSYATEDGTAVANEDYQSTSGTLTFQANGPTSQTVSVPVNGDVVDEPDEWFQLKLSDPSGAPIKDDTAIATITDNDTATLSVTDVTMAEGFNGWINSRTWEGVYWVTPMTGESYHLVRIAEAAAADDPWLVTGQDTGRFRFLVKTMGVKAMTLQAQGLEGKIRLTWQQDDFDLLAGYNLYRAASPDGPYERINESVIPVGHEWYEDTDVQPAVPMYYKFTVVQTDMQESDFSNVASAAAIDTIKPIIDHSPKTTAIPGAGVRLTATITDNVAVQEASVYYRPIGATEYTKLSMVNLSGNDWVATIPGSAVQPPGLEYYIVATDGLNETFHGTPGVPHTVVVESKPTLTSVTPNRGDASGGTRVTLAGTLFQPGATVEFGGVPATDVVVQTSTQILATTPPHFPAMVDVRVVNPDGGEAVLLNGFEYVDLDAVLSVPTMSVDHGAIVDIPVSMSNVDGLRAAELTLTYDPSVLRVRSVATGTLTSDWSLEANTNTAGQVIVSLAGATPASGDGTILKLNVEATGTAGATSVLHLQDVSLNDGSIQPNLTDGLFAVKGYYTLSGSVKYFQDNRPVPGVQLSLVGVGVQTATTDADGNYSFTQVQTGSYTLTPEKSTDVSHITAYDASLVLQATAGLLQLSSHQTVAADVNRNNSVTAMDASYILEKAVGLNTGAFPGAGRYWDFVPPERTYGLLNSDLTAQDFTAILLGDVSGDWTTAAGGQGQSLGSGNGAAGDMRSQTGSSGALVWIPDVAGQRGSRVTMPVQVTRNGNAVHGIDLDIRYDTSVLSLVSVELGGAANGFLWAVNTSQAGSVRAALAGAHPLPQDGTVLNLVFDVTKSFATPPAVQIDTAQLDEGAVAVQTRNGQVVDVQPPTVASLTPADDSTNVATSVRLVMTFGEDVQKGTGQLVIRRAADGAAVQTVDVSSGAVTVSGDRVTVDLPSSLAENTAYYVEVPAGAFTDLSGNAFGGLTDPVAWNFTTGDFSAPQVEDVLVGDGTGSRSGVRQVVVTFTEVVAIDAGAFRVTKRGPDGGDVGSVSFSVANVNGKTVATLTFAGAFVDASGALSDGNYELTIDWTKVRDAAGHRLDGDRDGREGSDFRFGHREIDNFFSLFGDSDGDGDVDARDLFLGFAPAFGSRQGQAVYRADMDWDGDGDVDARDLFLGFAPRFGRRRDTSGY